MGETFTAVAVERGVDWQGLAQTALSLLAIIVVLDLELRTLPRRQRKRDEEQARRERRLDEENARRSADLHRQALAHSERLAAEQRRAQLLFEVRRDLDRVAEEASALQFLSGTDAEAADRALGVFVRLERRARNARRIAVFLGLDEVAELMVQVVRQVKPFLDVALGVRDASVTQSQGRKELAASPPRSSPSSPRGRSTPCTSRWASGWHRRRAEATGTGTGHHERVAVKVRAELCCAVLCDAPDDLVMLGGLIACTSCAQRLARLAALEENRQERIRR